MSDARRTDDDLTGDDLRRVLEIADGHLEDAENVLWNASKRADADHATEIEALTRSVWDLQHRIDDLQRELEVENR
jgi:hypothetical protein